MSIPATVTATLPPIHTSHYGFSSTYHDQYPSGTNNYENIRDPSARLAPQYTPTYPTKHHLPSTTGTPNFSSSRHPQSSAPMPPKIEPKTQKPVKEDRRPNWEEFYKNGIPEQVIYIDVTPEPAKPQNTRTANITATSLRGGTKPQHVAKKRRTAQSPRSTVWGSGRPTQELQGSPSNTISTDRTTSIQNTTAPTSMGSHASHGSTNNYVDNQAVGSKRKRVTRGQVAADNKRKKEQEDLNDAYSLYVPPPRPPIKAKDVHVPPVRDVSFAF